VDYYANTLNFVHELSVDFIKFVYDSVELVHEMRKLYIYTFLQWFIRWGYQVYVW